ncbi:MAG: hypothetical protein Hyperionvirus6_7 [Hyperionvirus sp.]|uniref:Uncharacterized protein n=1 Tax=Hyperionvirus sp. TaxID=2487770 RepID=A0A3G5A7U0_9VIRU|nr:MAG: hypothetical protein Hyperionvirus6_7 [Hyperionvirus sp.]
MANRTIISARYRFLKILEDIESTTPTFKCHKINSLLDYITCYKSTKSDKVDNFLNWVSNNISHIRNGIDSLNQNIINDETADLINNFYSDVYEQHH